MPQTISRVDGRPSGPSLAGTTTTVHKSPSAATRFSRIRIVDTIIALALLAVLMIAVALVAGADEQARPTPTSPVPTGAPPWLPTP